MVAASVARVIYRPRIEGRENVPLTGPVILASNHLSFIDSMAIPIAAPRPVHFLAKSSYFDGGGVKGWFSNRFFRALGATPVQRGAGQAALDALDQQRRILQSGKAIALYPEGTRSRDGRLYRGRTGVAWLAMEAGCPIVPVGLRGTDQIQPVGARFPRRAKFSVEFGAPIEVAGRFDGVPHGKARRQLTDEVMTAILAMTGQEWAGEYNQRQPETPA